MSTKREFNQSISRRARIAEEIHKLIAKIASTDLKGAIPGFVTVTNVDISPDYKNAKVYVTQLDDDTSPEKTIEYLSNKSTYFKSSIAVSLRLRTVPRLMFLYDDSIQRALHLNKLIEGVSSEGQNVNNRATKSLE